jgi:hypothetical protein
VIEIIVALVGAGGGIAAAWFARGAKREVKTNNGMRAGEYIEMLPTMLKMLASHEEEDARRFTDIDQALEMLETKIGSDRRFTHVDEKLDEIADAQHEHDAA